MLEQGIREILDGDATVHGLTGGRVRPLIGAQFDVRPFVVYSVTAGESTATHQGPSVYKKANAEVAIYSDTYLGCAQLSELVKHLLDGIAATTTNCRIAPSLLDDESDIEQAFEPGKQTPVYLRTQTYRVLYRAV